jgi:hypothetical protein
MAKFSILTLVAVSVLFMSPVTVYGMSTNAQEFTIYGKVLCQDCTKGWNAFAYGATPINGKLSFANMRYMCYCYMPFIVGAGFNFSESFMVNFFLIYSAYFEKKNKRGLTMNDFIDLCFFRQVVAKIPFTNSLKLLFLFDFIDPHTFLWY